MLRQATENTIGFVEKPTKMSKRSLYFTVLLKTVSSLAKMKNVELTTQKMKFFIKDFFSKYSGISIRRTHHKADISIRRRANLGTERFLGQTLIRKSL